MSSHVWKVIYQTIVRLNRTIPNLRRKCQYSDTLIAAMYAWSVAHDRPRCWAAQKENYHGPFRPRNLPSRSQFERRLEAPRCQELLHRVHRELAQSTDASMLHFMDGRALPVGPYSQDRDARKGFASGQFAHGYKLHALSKNDGKIAAFRVKPLNVSEKKVANELIAEAKPSGLLLADGNYDAGRLYDLAWSYGALLFTPLPDGVGGGHRPQSPARLTAARWWAKGGAGVYRLRPKIERQFSQQSCFGGGLGPLPPWVRGLQRVTQWVEMKLTIYHARLTLRKVVA